MRIQLVLHAKQSGISTESGFAEAVVVEVELVFGDVGEMLELMFDLFEEAAGVSGAGVGTW